MPFGFAGIDRENVETGLGGLRLEANAGLFFLTGDLQENLEFI